MKNISIPNSEAQILYKLRDPHAKNYIDKSQWQKVLKVVCMCMLSHVWLFATSWTIAHQAPLSMRFPRQEYQSGLTFPPTGDLPYPRIQLFCISCIGSRIPCTSTTWEVLEISKTKATHIQDGNNKEQKWYGPNRSRRY